MMVDYLTLEEEEKIAVETIKRSYKINKGIDNNLDVAFQRVLQYYMEPYTFKKFVEKG